MLHEKAILMKLAISSFSPRRTDRRVTAETLQRHGADSKSGNFVKMLLPDEAVEPVRRLVGEIRAFHHQQTLPWGDDGTRMLPTANFDAFTGEMRRFRQRFEVAVQDFVCMYDSHVAAARTRLAGLFNADDYPPSYDVHKKFQFKLDPLPVPDGRDFRVTVATEEIKNMQNAVADRIAQAENAARDELIQRLANPLSAMVEKLSDPEGVFRDTLVANLREIVDLVPALNITGDTRIEEIRRRMRTDLTHYAPDELRSDKAARASAAEKAQDIMDQMSVFMAS